MGETGLQGTVALVTGAAGGGGGTAIVRHLHAAGAVVYASGLKRHSSALHELCEGEARLRPVLGDVTDPLQVDAVVRQITEEQGRLDVLVHNAAPSNPHRPTSELTTAQWRDDTSVILDAAFYLARGVTPAMVQQQYGRMVFISSSSAFRGAHGRSAGYAAAKAGLQGLTAQLALELGPHGITANAIAPSQIDTPRVRRGGRRDEGTLSAYAAQVPTRRAGRPDDLAALVTFLVSPASGYLTGQVVRLDGGSSLAMSTTKPKEGEQA